jgi:hypothetical protein
MQVVSMILGTTPAPWEDPVSAPELFNSLGSLKAVVLGLLSRDPRSRTSMAHCFVACNRILVQSSTKSGLSLGPLKDAYVSKVAQKLKERIRESESGSSRGGHIRTSPFSSGSHNA